MELSRLASAFLSDPASRALELEVETELHAHLELAREELEASGRSREEAAREARARFGDYEHIRRACVRARSRGIHGMKILLIVTNVMLLVALFGSLLFMRAMHARTGAALMESEAARAAAEQARAILNSVSESASAESRARKAPEPVDAIVIEVGDTLQVLRGASNFATGTVQADGNILLADVGWVRAAGMTRADLEAKITDAYNEFFTDKEPFYVIVGKPQQ